MRVMDSKIQRKILSVLIGHGMGGPHAARSIVAARPDVEMSTIYRGTDKRLGAGCYKFKHS